MKKILIIIISIIIILASAGAIYYFTKEKDDKNRHKVMTVTDVSKNCFSNALVVYDNNTYEVIKGAYSEYEDPVLHKGKYDYDIDSLILKIKEYPKDLEYYLNYQVVIENDNTYIVDMTKATELNDFISTLDKENIFWCSVK